MIDDLQELLATLQHHKLRTLLTALSVAWGIFMLVILLGAGKGLQNGVESNFGTAARNSISVRGNRTSLPYGGRPPGRKIVFTNDDFSAVQQSLRGIDRISGRYFRGNDWLSYGEEHVTVEIRGCHPDHRYLERMAIVAGRFIDPIDIDERRKVALLSPDVADVLFKGADPLGRYVKLGSAEFRVVGLYQDERSQGEARRVYIPISTAQLVYHAADTIHQILYTVGEASVEESERLADATRALLAERHGFSPDDRRALTLHNNLEEARRITQIFDWIRVFVWVVGIGTLFAGIVGVSNVVLISVKERTKEIGIRKAIGATPWSIVRSILGEATLVTALSGYAGLVGAVGVLEIVKKTIPDNNYVRNPEIDFGVALSATALLVVAGGLAGLVPAYRAARVNPVEAMREE